MPNANKGFKKKKKKQWKKKAKKRLVNEVETIRVTELLKLMS